jgi:hypothetical protein
LFALVAWLKAGLDSKFNHPFLEAKSLLLKEHVRRSGKTTFQGDVYNFLERPTGWKCFIYHFSV